MLSIKTEVKISTIPEAGKGLFAWEFVPKGTIVSLPVIRPGDFLITEAEYCEKLAENDTFPFNAGMRWIGNYFLCNDDQPDPSDYINHSEQPNLLSHCGIFFTLQDISIGDELTLDYREVMLKDKVIKLNQQGQVWGLSAKETLLSSAQKLIELLNEIDELNCPAIDLEILP